MSAEHHGHHDHEIDVDKHVRIYLIVFASLAALTVITVGISYLHLPLVPAVSLALLVATIKGSLVACYFMHLISERKLIYWVLGFTAFFFLFVLLVPMFTDADRVAY
jgi:cytochrome c oxidase subunit 4